jgi:hypothetical protein
MSLPRLRQLVFASKDMSPADDLRRLFDLDDAFPDPGVGEFGLDNAVFVLEDQFLEIIAPKEDQPADSTAAGRFLSRSGAGGYMAIFEVDDIAKSRAHIDDRGIRRVWDADLKSISASHLHPADVGGAILSIDQPRPPGSWTWGGPDWTERKRPGLLTGAIFESPDPDALVAKWGDALDLTVEQGNLKLRVGNLWFRSGTEERLVGFCLALPDMAATLARAAGLGLPISGSTILFQGVELHITER